jgi:hypothetical protein
LDTGDDLHLHGPCRGAKNELSGMLGRILISDQSIQGAPSYDPKLRFGDGLTFELNYARHIIGGDLLSLSLEVPLVVNADEDLHAAQNVIPQQYSSYFVTPAARLNLFPEQAVSPWVSIGGGVGHSVQAPPWSLEVYRTRAKLELVLVYGKRVSVSM